MSEKVCGFNYGRYRRRDRTWVGILAADPANELTVTTRKEFPSVENGCIRYVRGNAHDIGFVRSLVPVGAKWDCIVDFMVYTPDEFRERVDFLLSVCKQYVFLSSARVYAGSNEPDRRNLAEVVGYRKR